MVPPWHEIVAAVVDGELRIRAWRGDGTRFPCSSSGEACSMCEGGGVGFFANYGSVQQGGVSIAVVDVDLDDDGEIVVVPGPGIRGTMKAFEMDGCPVEGWKNFDPFGPGTRRGLTIAGTDRFLRR